MKGDQKGGDAVDVDADRGGTRAKPKKPPLPIWSDGLGAGTPPARMVELAEQVELIEPELLRGAIS
jgi:hypothetical protein